MSEVHFYQFTKTKKVMTVISEQTVPSVTFSLQPIEDGDNHLKVRTVEDVEREISELEGEIKRRQQLIAASSKTSNRDIPGIDLNKLIANGSGKVIKDAKERLALLKTELKNINSASTAENVSV
ncbi:MAG: hypothetical protein R3B55_02975 [Candidatus Paceibacterota bacterium]